MNKDEILAKSRAENFGQDERELHEYMRAGKASMVFGVVICFTFHFIQIIFNNNLSIISNACFAVVGGMSCGYYSLLLARLRKPLYWIAIGIYGFIFIGNIIMFMIKLCG